ncbi:MAG: hypothetical protein AAFR51_04020 [Pseudomonadota bacterium]
MAFRYVSSMVLATAFMGSANSDELCVKAVPGGEPILDVEVEQPYRIVRHPRQFPGLNGLLVHAFNRQQLLLFDGTSLSPVDADYPHIWGRADGTGLKQANDGWFYGLGAKPRQIFKLAPNGSNWLPITETENYKYAHFDSGSGELHLTLGAKRATIKGGQLNETVPFPFEEKNRLLSIRTFSSASTRLAVTVPLDVKRNRQLARELWAQRNFGDWQKIKVPEDVIVPEKVNSTEADVDGEMIRLFSAPPANSIFLSLKSSSPEFVGSAPVAKWQQHGSSGKWLGWTPSVLAEKSTRLGAIREVIEPPKLLLIEDQSIDAVRIDAVQPKETGSNQRFSFFTYIHEDLTFGRTLIRAKDGFVSFDGSSFYEETTLRSERIGELARIQNLGGRILLQSRSGLFELNGDLSVSKIASFPIDQPWPHEVKLGYMPESDVYIASDRSSGKLHWSNDLVAFNTLSDAARIDQIAAVLPTPEAALLIGDVSADVKVPQFAS